MIEQDGSFIITSKLLTYIQFKCRIKLPFDNECLKLAIIIRQGLSANKLNDYQFIRTTFFRIASCIYFPARYKWNHKQNKSYNEYRDYWELMQKPDNVKVFVCNLFSSWRRNE